MTPYYAGYETGTICAEVCMVFDGCDIFEAWWTGYCEGVRRYEDQVADRMGERR